MWQHVISQRPFSSHVSAPEETFCTGKWVVTFPLDDPDDLWERIVKAAVRGEVDATKMSAPRLDAIAGHHIACVYCRYSDPESVGKTLRVLRELGVEGPLSYKSDKATVEGRDEYLWTSEQIEGLTSDGLTM